MRVPFNPSDAENWYGGYYEAGMVVGSASSPQADDLLLTAIKRLWSNSVLKAASVGDRARWSWTNPPDLDAFALSDLHAIYGVFEHNALGTLPFKSVVVREERSHGDDWLYACVPLGGLSQSGGFPFGGPEHSAAARSWRDPLERSLAKVVLRICEVVPIEIAAIGFEIAGDINRAEAALTKSPRSVGYVRRGTNGFRYLPTTNW